MAVSNPRKYQREVEQRQQIRDHEVREESRPNVADEPARVVEPEFTFEEFIGTPEVPVHDFSQNGPETHGDGPVPLDGGPVRKINKQDYDILNQMSIERDATAQQPFVGAPTSRVMTNRPSEIDRTNQFNVPYSDGVNDDEINIKVQQALRQLLSGEGDLETRQMLGSVIVEPASFLAKTKAPAAPPRYLKHYRNDREPNKYYLELDMETRVPSQNPMNGEWMRFNRGHFFATTENQVKNMERMIGNQAFDEQGRPTVFDANIYEDDGAPDVVELEGRHYVRDSAGHKAAMKRAGQ